MPNKHNSIDIKIWNRDFEVEVEFDTYSDGTILDCQKDAIKELVRKKHIIDDSLPKVKEYCKAIDGEKIDGEIDNIFKYVIPRTFYIQSPNDKISHVVGLICAYKFNPDYGLVLKYVDEQLQEIGTSNIIY
ncbi:hypothetical protein NXH64_00915 [Butyrivibrio fibrisolvens]|uniref:DUF6985 domain-containing protein n=1 Tax=Pseudobutyrivibrio ruminis TaxID=46206 RepID=UPI000486EF8A|nr:hypothetical protein [Pseudobutyrivibrio ruminis]MDC7278052.1 hypothetical protein [Butyrivibrio fibrisolvens]